MSNFPPNKIQNICSGLPVSNCLEAKYFLGTQRSWKRFWRGKRRSRADKTKSKSIQLYFRISVIIDHQTHHGQSTLCSLYQVTNDSIVRLSPLQGLGLWPAPPFSKTGEWTKRNNVACGENSQRIREYPFGGKFDTIRLLLGTTLNDRHLIWDIKIRKSYNRVELLFRNGWSRKTAGVH